MSKTVVISGGSRGIGRAIAQKFAREGFNIAVCARSEEDLLNLGMALKDYGVKIVAYACDVSKPGEVKAFAAKVNATFGAVDVVVNNAGTFVPGRVIDEAEGTLEKLIETNLYSAYHLTRALLPAMQQRGSGHIFNMCSVASIKEYPNGGSYSISKFALLGFSKALREELKPYRIKVTALLPGATYTDSWAPSGLPEERFMKPSDIADVIWTATHLSDGAVMEEVLLRPVEGDI